MTVTLTTVAESLAICVALLAFVKMCWNVAEFAIGARKDISTLTATVGRLEKNLDDGMGELRARLLTLETKESIRVATEHLHDLNAGAH